MRVVKKCNLIYKLAWVLCVCGAVREWEVKINWFWHFRSVPNKYLHWQWMAICNGSLCAAVEFFAQYFSNLKCATCRACVWVPSLFFRNLYACQRNDCVCLFCIIKGLCLPLFFVNKRQQPHRNNNITTMTLRRRLQRRDLGNAMLHLPISRSWWKPLFAALSAVFLGRCLVFVAALQHIASIAVCLSVILRCVLVRMALRISSKFEIAV